MRRPMTFPPVLAFDLRGHGQSDKPGYGYTVARLAMDLKEILEQAEERYYPSGFVLVGTSMGCAVIWSLLQLSGPSWRFNSGLSFSSVDLMGVVLVDQAPLQNRRPDWKLGSLGCYDAASYEGLSRAVREDMSAFADANAEACFHNLSDVDNAIVEMVKRETLTCCPEALCELMYDHTHQGLAERVRAHDHPSARRGGS